MSPAPHRPTADPQEIIADLQRELAVCRAELDQRTAELSDALEQQTAAAEVLGVINSSPGDLAPVFDSMLDKALRLCGADFSNLLRYDGKLFHVASAVHGNREIGERNRGRAPFPPPPGGLLHPILQGEDVVYVEDLLHDPAYHSVAEIREMVDRGGYRSLLNVALRKDTALLGVIGIFRKESRPFGEKQIALLHNFAAQAVIAMENARLLTETREALERQTATAEVLGVINSSPGNLRPVFEAMLGQAIRLCEATFGHFRTYDGEGFPLAAVRGEPALVELHRQRFGHFVPGPHNPISRLVRGERLIHIPDTAADEAYRYDPDWPQLVAAGARSVLAVALRKDDALLGYINVYREVVGPFSDKQSRCWKISGSGGHRDGERAAPDRDARSPGAADRDRRGARRHNRVSDRKIAARCPRCSARPGQLPRAARLSRFYNQFCLQSARSTTKVLAANAAADELRHV